jgi:hypothetical protein
MEGMRNKISHRKFYWEGIYRENSGRSGYTARPDRVLMARAMGKRVSGDQE